MSEYYQYNDIERRAEDWDLANPILTGCLKIFQINMKLRIVIYRYKNPTDPTSIILTSNDDERMELFAECLVELKPKENIIPFVDAVIDSSRYYVVRIKVQDYLTLFYLTI